MKILFLSLLLFSCGTDRIVDVPDASCIAFEETCNGVDDDCNGLVDDMSFVKPCYPRSQSELVPIASECRFGLERCVSGASRCVSWIGPAPELCNGRDDDCDGDVDEGVSLDLDLVIALDYSGSMGEKISNSLQGMISWSSVKPSTGIRVALVGIPSPDYTRDGMVTKIVDFTDPQTFARSVDPMKQVGGGLEPSIDVIAMMTYAMAPVELSDWKPGAARAILVITDEPPQSVSAADSNYMASDELQMMTRAQAAAIGLRVLVMTDQDVSWKLWSTTPFATAEDFAKVLEDFVISERCR